MSRALLIYFADPMCSWCWGFAPVFAQLRARFGAELEPVLVAGGLAAGTTTPIDDATRASVRTHWQHVRDATGQPFDFAFFERERFVYDSEPACRALVAARGIAPGAEFALLTALHAAFYAGNRDVTAREVLLEVAVETGLERDAFAAAFDDPAARAATAADFALTQQAGISGFPALVVGSEAEGLSALSVGYQDFEPLAATLADWLAQRAAGA